MIVFVLDRFTELDIRFQMQTNSRDCQGTVFVFQRASRLFHLDIFYLMTMPATIDFHARQGVSVYQGLPMNTLLFIFPSSKSVIIPLELILVLKNICLR